MRKHEKSLFQALIGITFLMELLLVIGASYQDHKPCIEVARNHYGLLLITLICYLVVTFVRTKPVTSADYIRMIEELDWTKIVAYEIVEVSYQTAVEFAQSLRLSLDLYPDNESLNLMEAGELQTTNLRYDDYSQKGDHYQFLEYFLKKYNINNTFFTEERKKLLRKVFNAYYNVCESLTSEQRFMTIVSREHALPGLFQKILDSRDWDKWELGFYAYYLKEHIRLDSEEGGHADLLEDIELDEATLKAFWKARYEMYRALIPEEKWDRSIVIYYPPPC